MNVNIYHSLGKNDDNKTKISLSSAKFVQEW